MKTYPKKYKVYDVVSGLRITIPREVGWNGSDYVEIIKKDDDTLIIKRVLRGKV